MIDEHETIKTLESKLTYLFITRDKTIFEKQLSLLSDLKSKITETKNEYISQQKFFRGKKTSLILSFCPQPTFSNKRKF